VQTENKLNNLALLLGEDDAFETAFEKKIVQEKGQNKPKVSK